MKVGNIYSGSNDCEYEVVNCHRLQHILVRSTQLEYPHNYITSKHNILKGSLRNPTSHLSMELVILVKGFINSLLITHQLRRV